MKYYKYIWRKFILKIFEELYSICYDREFESKSTYVIRTHMITYRYIYWNCILNRSLYLNTLLLIIFDIIVFLGLYIENHFNFLSIENAIKKILCTFLLNRIKVNPYNMLSLKTKLVWGLCFKEVCMPYLI